MSNKHSKIVRYKIDIKIKTISFIDSNNIKWRKKSGKISQSNWGRGKYPGTHPAKEKDLPCSWIVRINILKMTILLKLVCSSNSMPVKLLMSHFTDLEKKKAIQ